MFVVLSGCVHEKGGFPNDDNLVNNISTFLGDNETVDNEYNNNSLIFLGNNSSRENNDVKFNVEKKYKIRFYKDKIYFGAFPDFGGREDNVSLENIEDFERLVGKEIAWAYFSNNWDKGINYPEKEINEIYSMGIIPFVRLMPRSKIEEDYKEEVYSLENIYNGKFDKEIEEWARKARDSEIPIFIDFGVEVNGKWFPWSGYYNGRDGEKFKKVYRHVVDIFNKENVTNVFWFFHVNVPSDPDEEWNKMYKYYPGDNYVDFIGLSVYGPLNPDEDCVYFSDLMKDNWEEIKKIGNKPLFVLEFGVTDGHKECEKGKWLKDAFETILNGGYGFAGISYWHENWEEYDGVYGTLRVDSSNESLKVFRKYINDSRFLGRIEFYGADKERVKFKPGMTWQWQLNGKLNKEYNVDVYDIDLFDTKKEDIEELHKKGIKVICYFSGGSWENWRNDKDEFPEEVIGKTLEGWEDEKWLDVSKFERFKEVIEGRMDLAKEKGCDAIEVDNVDGYVNPTGFNITYKDQLRYNMWLCNEAHKRGLSIGLKNDLEQVNDLVDCYDFAINEQCFQYDECDVLKEFVKRDKAVFGVEYELDKKDFCDNAKSMGFSWLKMDYELDGGREGC